MSSVFLGLTLMQPDLIDIQFSQQFGEDERTCYSTAWLGDDVIVGGTGGVSVYDPINNKCKEISMPGVSVHSVKTFGRFAVAALCQSDNENMEIRLSCLDSLPHESARICKYDQDDTWLAHMAVSEQRIASADIQAKLLRVYNFKGVQLLALGSGKLKHPWGVLLQKNSVFVSDWIAGCLYKYRLEADSEPEWICAGVKSPTGICQDKDGFLYVASNGDKLIYLISPQGVLTKSLSCEELAKTKDVHDICLSEDGTTLALACREEGVKLFTVQRD